MGELEREIVIDATPETIWPYLTDPERFVEWHGTEAELDPRPEGDKTRVRLAHRGLPDDAVDDHVDGWTHYLDRLAVRVTGGDPGPDRITDGG